MSKPNSTSVPVAKKATYTDLLATCVADSKLVESLNKTITKFASKDDAILTVWSKDSEHHNIAIGQRCLLTKVEKPDGAVFYNL